MLKEILPLIPPHFTYVEPYFGGGAVFRAKEPSQGEIINDLNLNVVNFYAVLKNDFERLKTKITATLHSRATYKKALFVYHSPELFTDAPLIRAWAFYVVTNQWFAHKIGSRWYDSTDCAHTVQRKIDAFANHLSERLKYTQIEHNEAHKVIASRDSKHTFYYLDPPYINTNQGHYSGYSSEDFVRDLEVLATIQGKFLLSCFPSDEINAFIKKHKRHVKTFLKPSSAGNRLPAGQGKRKTEVLVANYPI